MQYNKLVRDKIPEILDAKGVPYEARAANDEEYKVELIKKLEEEILEFKENPVPEELADIQEVVDALKKLSSFESTDAVQKQKREERGGFEKRIIIKGEK